MQTSLAAYKKTLSASFSFIVVLRIEMKASHMFCKHSAIELHPQNSVF